MSFRLNHHNKIIDGVDLISADLSLPPTQRTFQEQHDIFDELFDS